VRAYWQFYWPLALTGLALVLAVQFQNGVLARYPEAATELAVYALAWSIYGFVYASLIFVAQLTNVFARSPGGTRRCQRFVVAVSLVLALALLTIGQTPPGQRLLEALFDMPPGVRERVSGYLLALAPLLLLSGQRYFYTGLLVQARLTGWVTLLNVAFLSTMIGALIAGFRAGWPPVAVLVGAEAFAMTLQIAGTVAVKLRRYRLPERLEHEGVRYGELLRFFVPVSMTGVMFALSRPLLYGFVSRTPDGLLAIAALRVAFDFSMMFQEAANQFRHFFVTFGMTDLATKRRFMTLVAAALTGLMVLFVATPLADWIWREVMRVPDEVRALSLPVLAVMCLMPTVIVFRNYNHGRLLHERRTGGMAIASVLRAGGILLFGQLAFSLDLLDHVSAAVILILGFVIEAAVVYGFARHLRASSARADAARLGAQP